MEATSCSHQRMPFPGVVLEQRMTLSQATSNNSALVGRHSNQCSMQVVGRDMMAGATEAEIRITILQWPSQPILSSCWLLTTQVRIVLTRLRAAQATIGSEESASHRSSPRRQLIGMWLKGTEAITTGPTSLMWVACLKGLTITFPTHVQANGLKSLTNLRLSMAVDSFKTVAREV